MLKHLIVIVLLFAYSNIFSQKEKDKSKDHKGDSEYDLKNYKSDPNDRCILEVNHTGWVNLPQGIKLSATKSIGVNFSLLFDKPIKHSAFSFGYGLGLFSHNFHSNADFVYQRDSVNQVLRTTLQPFNRPFTLNRYAQKIIEIPLELRFRTKTNRQFKMHFGGKIGYMVHDFRSIRDNDGKFRLYYVKNIAPLRYGVHFRIGYEQICLTACYYFNEVFTDKGPQGIRMYSLGIAIIPY
jgi:hypothetical protein